MKCNYQILFPSNYRKPELPGRDEWCLALRNIKQDKDERKVKCPITILAQIQNRINNHEDDETDYLRKNNPLFEFLGKTGEFPDNIKIILNENPLNCIFDNIAQLFDSNYFSLSDIAQIIENIWNHAPKNWREISLMPSNCLISLDIFPKNKVEPINNIYGNYSSISYQGWLDILRNSTIINRD